MSRVSLTARSRVELQGFRDLDDRTLARINHWLRLAPALCMAWAATGTVLASAAVLWALVPFALLGGLLPGHPFDVIYNHGLRHLVGGPRLPPYPRPRRFACLLASAILVAAALGFQYGVPLVGYVMGGSLVAAAFVNVGTGFCIPSFLYGLIFGKPGSCLIERPPSGGDGTADGAAVPSERGQCPS